MNIKTDSGISRLIRLTGIYLILIGILTGFTFSPFTGLWTTQNLNAASVRSWPHDQTDLTPDPAIIFGILPNGIRYALMENHTPKDRVSMHLMIQAGSLNETDSERGIAHFLEHMVFNGSTHFKPGEIVKYFQTIGMDFGPDANAHTGFEETVYDLNLPSADTKSIADALMVLNDFATGALLLPSEVNRERSVILAEKRTRDSSAFRTLQSTLNFEFPNVLISKRLPIGEESDLIRMSHDDLKRFYETWYSPDRMTLIMVGAFEPQTVIPLINAQFSGLEPRQSAAVLPDFGILDHQGLKSFYHYESESGKTTVSIGIVEPILPVKDSFDQIKSRLHEKLANQIIQNRLDAKLGKTGTPFTSAEIGSEILLNRFRYAEINAATDPENWESSLTLIEQNLRGALENGFSASETDRVRKDFLTMLDNQVQKTSTRNSTDIAKTIMDQTGDNRVILSPEQQKNLLEPVLLELTPDILHQAFQRAWESSHRLIQITGNADLQASESMSPESRILSAFQRSQKTETIRPVEETIKAFPYLETPVDSGIIQAHDELADLGIIRVQFKNGVNLNLKKTGFKKNQVKANLIFGSGSSMEPADKPGLSLLTTNVINESGVGGLTRDELERSLAGKSTRISFMASEDRFAYQTESVSSELLLMFQLLNTCLVDPAFRDEALSLATERYRQQYQQYIRSVDGMARIHAKKFFSGGDPRFGLPNDDQFASLTLNDVKSWITPYLKEAPLELSIVGDFDVDQALRLASRYLGSLPKRHLEKTSHAFRHPMFPAGQSTTLSVDTAIPKSLIMAAYKTDDFWNIKRTRRLSILGDVFSDRLREQVREKLGAAYSPAAFNHPSRAYAGYGVFQAMVHVNPSDAQKIVDEIHAIAKKLSAAPISDNELKRAIDPAITRIKDMLQTNEYWLNSVLTGSASHPVQLEWSRTLQSDYAAITRSDLFRLAKTYFKPDNSAVLIIQPGS